MFECISYGFLTCDMLFFEQKEAPPGQLSKCQANDSKMHVLWSKYLYSKLQNWVLMSGDLYPLCLSNYRINVALDERQEERHRNEGRCWNDYAE